MLISRINPRLQMCPFSCWELLMLAANLMCHSFTSSRRPSYPILGDIFTFSRLYRLTFKPESRRIATFLENPLPYRTSIRPMLFWKQLWRFLAVRSSKVTKEENLIIQYPERSHGHASDRLPQRYIGRNCGVGILLLWTSFWYLCQYPLLGVSGTSYHTRAQRVIPCWVLRKMPAQSSPLGLSCQDISFILI